MCFEKEKGCNLTEEREIYIGVKCALKKGEIPYLLHCEVVLAQSNHHFAEET